MKLRLIGIIGRMPQAIPAKNDLSVRIDEFADFSFFFNTDKPVLPTSNLTSKIIFAKFVRNYEAL